MSKRGNTRAIVALRNAGVAFEVHEYTLGPATDDTYGEAVASRLRVEPERLFKTLVTTVDAKPTVAIVPVSDRLSLKALAKVAGGKRAAMADHAAAERWTGYVTGGISPFGQTRQMPVFVDASIGSFTTIYASGGRRGLQIEVEPSVLVEMLTATLAQITEH